MAPPPPKLLLPSSSSSDSESDSDRDALPINEDYARRFEHNKRREDLHRLSDLQKRGLLPSSSSSSDDDDDSDDDPVASTKTDLQFFDALVKVKLQDPLIHLKDAKLYASDDDDSDDVAEKEIKKEKQKPMYIKDVTAKHLLEDGPEFDETPAVASQSKLYSREQEDNRRAFLDAAESPGSDDDVEFFKEKVNSEARPEDPDDAEVRRKMDEYFGEDRNLDENELFLKNFMKKRMWTAEADGAAEDGELSEDEDELEKQEKYEAEYNFRYEEGVGDRVLGHARVVEGSVRKKSNARKEQRKRREERAAQAEAERKEELKRLKNLKKREIEEKLEKIRAVAGIRDGGVSGLGGDDLEEEFDPVEYDRKMKEMFDDDYYGAEDADPDFKSGDEGDGEKPDFDREDELLGLPKGWDVGCTGEGFKTAREKSMKRKEEARVGERGEDEEEEEEEEDGDEEIDEENGQREGKSKRKRKITLREKVELDKELEEYYKLDYEDTIGDLKTRFKYKSVPSNKYGLNAAEILMADEKDLNQYVSLKKLAPYRQDEWKVHKMKKHQILTKLYNQGENVERGKGDEKHHSKGSHSERSGKKPQDAVTNGDASGQDLPSRRSRRRRRQLELKLSQSRLMAYGKVAHNPKKQKKH